MDLKFEIKDELAQLSHAIAEVQTMDGQLFEAKVSYQREITEARRKLYKMYKAHRAAIEKAKPYYVAKELETQLLHELDEVEEMTEKARYAFEDSKENEDLAQQALHNARAREFSDGDQTMILENWNRATEKVLEASRQRADSEDTLRRKEEQYLKAHSTADQILIDLKPAVMKAWPYYSMKEQFEKQLEKKRKDVHKFGRQLATAKENYKITFARLNLVATEIQQRKTLSNKDSLDASKNMSQFEEVTDIDSVLSALESKAEDLSSSFDQMEEDDFQYDLLLAPSLKHYRMETGISRTQSLINFTPTSDDFRGQSGGDLKKARTLSLSASATSLDLDKKIVAEMKKNHQAQADQRRKSLESGDGDTAISIPSDSEDRRSSTVSGDVPSEIVGNDRLMAPRRSSGELRSIISTTPTTPTEKQGTSCDADLAASLPACDEDVDMEKLESVSVEN